MNGFAEMKSILAGTQSIILKMEDNALLDELTELSAKLEGEKFNLALVGLFKRGKSTLINALLGKEIAPVAVTPLTAIITLFEYGEKSFAEIVLTDKCVLKVGINEVDQYVSEEKNSENQKQVAYVRVFDNCELLRSVTLVDTPGLGSVFGHNSQTTSQFLPKVDAALFLLSADIPVTQVDMDFLKDLRLHVGKIIFVLNKTDLLGDTEQKKMIEFNVHVISKFLGRPVTFIPVSAKRYFEMPGNKSSDGIISLREVIAELTKNEKSGLLLHNTTVRVQALLSKAQLLLGLKKEALQTPLHQLEAQQNTLRESIENMETGREDFEALIKAKVERLQKSVETKVKTLSQEIRNTLKEQTNEKANPSFEVANAMLYQQKTLKEIVEHFEAGKIQLEAFIIDEFRRMLEEYSLQTHSFLGELFNQLNLLGGGNVQQLSGTFDLEVYSSFYFHKQPEQMIPNLAKNPFWRFFPAHYLKRKILRQIRQNGESLIVSNGAGIMYDLNYKIQESFRKFSADLNQKRKSLIESMLRIIEEIFQKRNRSEIEMQEQLAEIATGEKTLCQLKENLDRFHA